MNHVKQQDPTGCAIACVAMVAGKTYSEAMAAYGRPLESRGMTNREISDLLKKLGVTNCDVIPFHGPIIRSVPSPMGSHWVVIDANGNKLDPASESQLTATEARLKEARKHMHHGFVCAARRDEECDCGVTKFRTELDAFLSILTAEKKESV